MTTAHSIKIKRLIARPNTMTLHLFKTQVECDWDLASYDVGVDIEKNTYWQLKHAVLAGHWVVEIPKAKCNGSIHTYTKKLLDEFSTWGPLIFDTWGVERSARVIKLDPGIMTYHPAKAIVPVPDKDRIYLKVSSDKSCVNVGCIVRKHKRFSTRSATNATT